MAGVGQKCGLIGPNAAVVVGSSAYWMSPVRQFHSYTLGGAVQTIACPIRKDMADNIAASQADKIVASSIAEFNEVWFFYPDRRDGYENSRYIACAIDGPDAGAWFRGQLARTAACDAGPSPYAIGVSVGGNVYWHEKGASADGGPLSWRLQTADMYLDENVSTLVRKYLPDLSGDQLGAVNLTVTTTMAPEDPAPRSFGPYVIPKGTREVDMLAEGRLFSLTFSGSSYPSYMRLGRLLFDAKPRGRR